MKRQAVRISDLPLCALYPFGSGWVVETPHLTLSNARAVDLDRTRIHPEWYPVAAHLAILCLGLDEDPTPMEMCVSMCLCVRLSVCLSVCLSFSVFASVCFGVVVSVDVKVLVRVHVVFDGFSLWVVFFFCATSLHG